MTAATVAQRSNRTHATTQWRKQAQLEQHKGWQSNVGSTTQNDEGKRQHMQHHAATQTTTTGDTHMFLYTYIARE